MRNRALHIASTVIAIVLASAVSMAFAANRAPRTVTVAATGVIDACVNNKTHAIYRETSCPKGYTRLTWNSKGPAGAPGKSGANGLNGSNGANGTNGTSATISVGTVSTGAAGSNAAVTNSGTSSAAKLNFTIPQGATGAAGTDGSGITSATATTLSAGSSATATLSGSGANQTLHVGIPTGATGAAGVAPFSTPTVWSATGNYCKATSTTPGSTVTFDGSTYLYTATNCGPGNELNAQNQEVVNPADWTVLAEAGANGSATGWATFDPGQSSTSAGSQTGVIETSSSESGAWIQNVTASSPGTYAVGMGGCSTANPALPDINVTPESTPSTNAGTDPGSAKPIVIPTVSMVTDLGQGDITFNVTLYGSNGGSTPSLTAAADPFSVTINC